MSGLVGEIVKHVAIDAMVNPGRRDDEEQQQPRQKKDDIQSIFPFTVICFLLLIAVVGGIGYLAYLYPLIVIPILWVCCVCSFAWISISCGICCAKCSKK